LTHTVVASSYIRYIEVHILIFVTSKMFFGVGEKYNTLKNEMNRKDTFHTFSIHALYTFIIQRHNE